MTYDAIPSTLLRADLFRLWIRDHGCLSHWTMLAVGPIDDVESAYIDCGAHHPSCERLVLPAAEKPCGDAAKCDLCDRAAVYRGHTRDGVALILLCKACLSRSSK